MVNFGAPDTVPERYKGRLFYEHNANVTLMRTNVDENAQLGAQLAAKLSASRGPVTVLLPLQGLSVVGMSGGPFHWPAADAALFDALKRDLRPDIPVIELDCGINAPEFARRCATELIASIGAAAPG